MSEIAESRRTGDRVAGGDEILGRLVYEHLRQQGFHLERRWMSSQGSCCWPSSR